MRLNTEKVCRAFDAGKHCRKSDSVWTNGDSIYSYETCILTRRADGGLILNETRYSATTMVHQLGIAAWFGSRITVRVTGVYGYSNGLPRHWPDVHEVLAAADRLEPTAA